MVQCLFGGCTKRYPILFEKSKDFSLKEFLVGYLLLDKQKKVWYNLDIIKEKRIEKMSIINSIKNTKIVLNCGADRYVSYSKKYDVIIKRNYSNARMENDFEQTEQEIRIFGEMTEEEKEIFPIVDVVYYKNEKIILMKKCTPINDLLNIFDYWKTHSKYVSNIESAKELTKRLSLDDSYLERYVSFIDKYDLVDVHIDNVGVYNNHLVILDAGY